MGEETRTYHSQTGGDRDLTGVGIKDVLSVGGWVEPSPTRVGGWVGGWVAVARRSRNNNVS